MLLQLLATVALLPLCRCCCSFLSPHFQNHTSNQLFCSSRSLIVLPHSRLAPPASISCLSQVHLRRSSPRSFIARLSRVLHSICGALCFLLLQTLRRRTDSLMALTCRPPPPPPIPLRHRPLLSRSTARCFTASVCQLALLPPTSLLAPHYTIFLPILEALAPAMTCRLSLLLRSLCLLDSSRLVP